MTFIKTDSYYQYKIANIEKAISGTKLALRRYEQEGAGSKVIDAHEAQIATYKKNLVAAQEEYDLFKEKNNDGMNTSRVIDGALFEIQKFNNSCSCWEFFKLIHLCNRCASSTPSNGVEVEFFSPRTQPTRCQVCGDVFQTTIKPWMGF